MAEVHALMDRAVVVFDARRYREALALCDEVERLDPSAAMPEIMRNEYRRVVRKRRARRAAVLVGGLVVALGLAIAVRQLARIRPRPGDNALELAETEQQTFTFTSGIGRHKALEYTWALLAADGRPPPDRERNHLKIERSEPWTCSYAPDHGTVRGTVSQGTVTRRIVGIGVDGAGEQVVRAEWIVTVRDGPQAPRIVAAEPSPRARLALTPGGSRTFRVAAEDGDGGTDVDYKWLVGNESKVVSTTSTWTYRRPPAPDGTSPQGPRMTDEGARELIVCRVANRAGKAAPHVVTWVIRLVDRNTPPEILAVEPDLRGTIRLHPQRILHLEAAARDPDRDDEVTYRWEFDGNLVAQTARCDLFPPVEPSGTTTPHRLRLTVTDICGATVERTWALVVDPN